MPLLIIIRSVQGLLAFACLEIVPLWTISTIERGGLEWSQAELGTLLSVSAAGSSLWVAKGMPKMTKFFGLRHTAALGGAVTACAFCVMPFVERWAVLALVHAVASCARGLVGPTLTGCLNNAAPPDQRAMLNGFVVGFE